MGMASSDVEWRKVLERSDFSTGCSVLGVTVTSDSEVLMLVATTEGAVVLARAQRDMKPLDDVRDQLQRLGRTIAAG
ncbi:hypothetical protein ACFRJ9_00635 [Paenarthrobacter sp. NPDC056912]|uniref:hypothetical protein n=1 Tax=Paenarthrobacter sp. NPDC056912 TaxID=3345965 RepID=UPI00366D9DEA